MARRRQHVFGAEHLRLGAEAVLVLAVVEAAIRRSSRSGSARLRVAARASWRLRSGSTPCAAAASATVAVLVVASTISISGACSARKVRTDCRLIASIPLSLRI
jgi:hypothetical protein